MTRAARHAALPSNLPPRGIDRVEAAAYIGVSPSKLDQMVGDGRMPRPRAIDGRRVFDRVELDLAFSRLPHDGTGDGADDDAADDRWSQVAV